MVLGSSLLISDGNFGVPLLRLFLRGSLGDCGMFCVTDKFPNGDGEIGDWFCCVFRFWLRWTGGFGFFCRNNTIDTWSMGRRNRLITLICSQLIKCCPLTMAKMSPSLIRPSRLPAPASRSRRICKTFSLNYVSDFRTQHFGDRLNFELKERMSEFWNTDLTGGAVIKKTRFHLGWICAEGFDNNANTILNIFRWAGFLI